MVQAYCVRCKKKVLVTNPKNETAKNGRLMVRGTCPHCEGKVCGFVKKE